MPRTRALATAPARPLRTGHDYDVTFFKLSDGTGWVCDLQAENVRRGGENTPTSSLSYFKQRQITVPVAETAYFYL